jgi:hypothetical protein
MKIATYFVLFFTITSCRSLNSDKEIGDKKNDSKVFEYIFILDKIEESTMSFFDKVLDYPLDEDIQPLTQYQPYGFERITFTVYLTSNYDIKPISTISFSDKSIDKDERAEVSEDFKEKLRKQIGSTSMDRYILLTVEKVLKELKNNKNNYVVIFNTNWLENSGGAIRKGDSHNNGDFRFVTVDKSGHYSCNSDHFEEAINSLKDNNSWISRHLIKFNKGNNIKRTQFFYCSQDSPRIHVENSKECNIYEDFWNPLFHKLNIDLEDTKFGDLKISLKDKNGQ